jgi:outer membrane protein W
MSRKIAIACAAAGLGLLLAPAAADAEPASAKPWWKRRLYIRALGVAHVATLEQSREMELADIDGPASLAVGNGPIAGSGATINSSTIPAVNLGIRLPVLQDRLSLEVVAGTLFTVEFQATGTLANESIAPMALGIPTGVPALGPELGRAQAVPLVTTAVYQLMPARRLQPYAGAGVAVMFARNAEITNALLTEVGDPDFSIAPAPGLVLQAGIDAKLWRSVYARLDLKFIAGMLARAEVHHIQVKTPSLPLFDNVEVGTAKMSVWVNPLIVQAGIGMDFDMF